MALNRKREIPKESQFAKNLSKGLKISNDRRVKGKLQKRGDDGILI
jgi:hypothetical protein